MAERQRSFRDMFPDLMGSLTQGAQWKRGMTPLSEKEMTLSKERALTQEQRKWKHDQRMKQWLDYTSMWPGNIARKSLQTGIWDRVPAKIKKRIKRQIKEFGETRPEPNPTAVEALEAHEQVSDRMGYNPTDWYVGEPRSPSDHSMDLAGRFLQFLRDKDARPDANRPDPDTYSGNVAPYMRWVADKGKRAAERREAGLPPLRDDSERFDQVDRARQKRFDSLNDAVIDRLPSDFQSSGLGDPSSKPSQSIMDLLNRTMGRRLSRDLPSTNR